MADIIPNDDPNKIVPLRMIKSIRKISAPRIDMTPMVDLGFLLITFFIFTTEISRPSTANLYMPRDGGTMDIPASESITFLLAANDQVFYYFGSMDRALLNKFVYKTSYGEFTRWGNIIRQKQAELKERAIDPKHLVVLIKPTIAASYKNVVAVLDEKIINGVRRYALCDPEPQEAAFLAR